MVQREIRWRRGTLAFCVERAQYIAYDHRYIITRPELRLETDHVQQLKAGGQTRVIQRCHARKSLFGGGYEKRTD